MYQYQTASSMWGTTVSAADEADHQCNREVEALTVALLDQVMMMDDCEITDQSQNVDEKDECRPTGFITIKFKWRDVVQENVRLVRKGTKDVFQTENSENEEREHVLTGPCVVAIPMLDQATLSSYGYGNETYVDTDHNDEANQKQTATELGQKTKFCKNQKA